VDRGLSWALALLSELTHGDLGEVAMRGHQRLEAPPADPACSKVTKGSLDAQPGAT